MQNKTLLLIFVIGWILVAVLRWHLVTPNVTNSEPLGLYILAGGPPGSGNMVELRPLLKHVKGRPGDTVCFSPAGVSVNGRPLKDTAPAKQTYGYRLQPFGCQTLSLSQYYLIGTGRDSWDSRIAGPFPWDAIAFNLKPLWIIGGNHERP